MQIIMKVKTNKDGEKYYIDENNTTWHKDSMGRYTHGNFRKSGDDIFRLTGTGWKKVKIQKIDWKKLVDKTLGKIKKQHDDLSKKFTEECAKLNIRYTDNINDFWNKKYAKKSNALLKKLQDESSKIYYKYHEKDATVKPGFKLI